MNDYLLVFQKKDGSSLTPTQLSHSIFLKAFRRRGKPRRSLLAFDALPNHLILAVFASYKSGDDLGFTPSRRVCHAPRAVHD